MVPILVLVLALARVPGWCTVEASGYALPPLYSNHFIAHLRGPPAEGASRPLLQRAARDLAERHSMRLLPTVVSEGAAVHLVDPRLPRLSSRAALRRTRSLAADSGVAWAQQQTLRYRGLRQPPPRSLGPHVLAMRCGRDTIDPEISAARAPNGTIIPWRFNDPFYPQQWYLHGGGGDDLLGNVHVPLAWNAGLTGRGVTLFVLDDGVQNDNPEIAQNFEPRGGGDVSALWRPLPDLPAPRTTEDAHGTYCASIVAAAADNGVCGVGIAYHAKVGGVRLLGGGPVSDLQEALALSLWLGVADIASASWGPKDNGMSLDGPGHLTKAAIKRAIRKGRNGLGAILVWAAGNGGLRGDSCSCDGYTSSPYTVTIGAITHTGESCVYSEACGAVLASVFVGGPFNPCGVASVVVPELDGTCRASFQGTSAAAPIAAGLIALALEANPRLTWREVQHAVVASARPHGLGALERAWRVNGAGLHFHPQQGFGAMHAGRLVTAARHFASSPLPPQGITAGRLEQTLPVVIEGLGKTTVFFYVAPEVSVTSLEHVILTVSLLHPRRGGLRLVLESPAGTELVLSPPREHDDSPTGLKFWPLLTVHAWGENPVGRWRLLMDNQDPRPGKLTFLRLQLWGHS